MAILDSQGEQASVKLHKNCYCSFISKEHIKRLLARKRKAGSMDLEEAPIPRVRRSQVKEFDLKKQCLFCTLACEPVNNKHPDRWDKVVQCERRGVKDAPPFKAVILQYVMIVMMHGVEKLLCVVMVYMIWLLVSRSLL